MQILLHFQSSDAKDQRFDDFLSDFRALVDKHGIRFEDYQSVRLHEDDYRIRPCDRCGHLTVNRQDIEPSVENMLPDFWSYVRRGKVGSHIALCELCDRASNAT
jgi:hypothetical protein